MHAGPYSKRINFIFLVFLEDPSLSFLAGAQIRHWITYRVKAKAT